LESENAQLKEKIKVLEDKIVKLESPPIAKKAAVKSKKKKYKPLIRYLSKLPFLKLKITHL
jgi:hypothetical protein